MDNDQQQSSKQNARESHHVRDGQNACGDINHSGYTVVQKESTKIQNRFEQIKIEKNKKTHTQKQQTKLALSVDCKLQVIISCPPPRDVWTSTKMLWRIPPPVSGRKVEFSWVRSSVHGGIHCCLPSLLVVVSKWDWQMSYKCFMCHIQITYL